MITRQQYMTESQAEHLSNLEQGKKNREGYNLGAPLAHRRYYAQFVTEAIKQKVLRAFTLSDLMLSFQYDESFNHPATPLRRWDSIRLFTSTDKQLRECSDWLSLGTQVCILKEAARQIVEEHKQEVSA